ncbi:putative RRP45-exosome complex exonuclease [Acaromyces ingoldii]|uniref:Putative RRP45-exosome complex exonuclease n=1 Tax=Acaromyces ingoldii TaxID=215250 RepID=A0A316Z2C4_9BASI|nr:putative RRP45-exosome complex exonuclease [Acaromyces ingoldii]PWN94333.1 putative RRP45-exosome complex exonuclease [Acaromyces ingoldii]
MPLPGTLLEPSLTEVDFVKSSLLSSIRPDGRSFLESRPLSVAFSSELGWVEVKLGQTRVLATTYASLVAPRSDRPYEGILELRAEVQPMAGVQFERNRTGEEEVLFERALDKAVRRSECLDREGLCVVAGQKVWSVVVTVHLLSAQGSALDAAVLASILSLRHFRRPDVSIESDTGAGSTTSASRKAASTTKPRVIVHDVSERVPIPLALHHHPLAVSFAIFDKAHMASAVVSGVGGKTSTAATTAPQEGGDELENIIILVDPTPLETTLCTSKMYVVANVQGEICVLDKAGGRPLGEGVLQRVTEIARRRVKELAAVMEAELQRDARDRVLEVR